MKRPRRTTAVYLGLGLLAVVVGLQLFGGGEGRKELTLTQFGVAVDRGEVSSATIKDRSNQIQGELDDGTDYRVNYPGELADEMASRLDEAEPRIAVDVDRQQDSLWASILVNLLPFLLLFGVFFFLVSSMQGGGSRVMQFGKSRARRAGKDQPTVTFADVAGADEAVEELQEIKDFLADPARFQSIGARIPKGVLLYGPPGTGKTLLARAVAGEAGVPFFTISGSDFVEMFVGVGASRVRDLFEQAKSSAPAIVFVDEIDAVGRHRGAGMGGGHDEREQTLNQLLVEMDGFEARTGVILIAATNRPDILDPALLRPGRFDRQIVVDQPDLEGRKAILAVHAKGKPLDPDVRLDVVARRTPGFTGADLANLMNEAALMAARRDHKVIGDLELEAAIDRVLAGPERRTRVMSEREKRVIATHEAGHALVGHVLPGTDPIHKISIVSRGRALGWTLALPTEDKYLRTRSELEDTMAMLLGGRTAEELTFGEITTGASDDIERCTEIARSMVTQFGMSDLLGPRRLGQTRPGDVFLGREAMGEPALSAAVAGTIDGEIRRLVDAAHRRAEAILRAHQPILEHLADRLVAHETLDDSELAEVFGPLDKGVGIEVTDPAEPVGAAGRGPLVAAGVADGAGVAAPEAVPAPVGEGSTSSGPVRRRGPRSWRLPRAHPGT